MLGAQPEIFARGDASVANLTDHHPPSRAPFALIAMPLYADDWSVGGGVGPFIFGHFVKRSVRLGTETGGATNRTRLSAATRAGVAADVERDLNRWLALRLEASWVGSPLRIKSASGDQGTNIDAGRLNLTTLVLPLLIRINPNGAFRRSARKISRRSPRESVFRNRETLTRRSACDPRRLTTEGTKGTKRKTKYFLRLLRPLCGEKHKLTQWKKPATTPSRCCITTRSPIRCESTRWLSSRR